MKKFDICVKQNDCGIKNDLTTTVVCVDSKEEINGYKDELRVRKKYKSAKGIQNCTFWIPTSMKQSEETLHWYGKIDNYSIVPIMKLYTHIGKDSEKYRKKGYDVIKKKDVNGLNGNTHTHRRYYKVQKIQVPNTKQ